MVELERINRMATSLSVPPKEVPVELQPGRVPEWEAEDALLADLGPEQPLSEEQIKQVLDEMYLTLPVSIDSVELTDWAGVHNTPLNLPITEDLKRYSFHLMRLTVNIISGKSTKIFRLRLQLDFGSATHISELPVAIDLFPKDSEQFQTYELGEAKLDISKGLSFVVGKNLSECLGLSLKVPLRWKTQTVRIETSDRNSNPLVFRFGDKSIRDGVEVCAIVKAIKGAPLKIKATLACEVRHTGIGGLVTKARFVGQERDYYVGGSHDGTDCPSQSDIS
jgi:hypothetical protein